MDEVERLIPIADSDSKILNDSMETLMYTDKPLTPKMVSSMLHIDVLLHNPGAHQVYELSDNGSTDQKVLYVISVIAASLLLSVLFGVGLLYAFDIALFE